MHRPIKQQRKAATTERCSIIPLHVLGDPVLEGWALAVVQFIGTRDLITRLARVDKHLVGQCKRNRKLNLQACANEHNVHEIVRAARNAGWQRVESALVFTWGYERDPSGATAPLGRTLCTTVERLEWQFQDMIQLLMPFAFSHDQQPTPWEFSQLCSLNLMRSAEPILVERWSPPLDQDSPGPWQSRAEAARWLVRWPKLRTLALRGGATGATANTDLESYLMRHPTSAQFLLYSLVYSPVLKLAAPLLHLCLLDLMPNSAVTVHIMQVLSEHLQSLVCVILAPNDTTPWLSEVPVWPELRKLQMVWFQSSPVDEAHPPWPHTAPLLQTSSLHFLCSCATSEAIATTSRWRPMPPSITALDFADLTEQQDFIEPILARVSTRELCSLQLTEAKRVPLSFTQTKPLNEAAEPAIAPRGPRMVARFRNATAL